MGRKTNETDVNENITEETVESTDEFVEGGEEAVESTDELMEGGEEVVESYEVEDDSEDFEEDEFEDVIAEKKKALEDAQAELEYLYQKRRSNNMLSKEDAKTAYKDGKRAIGAKEAGIKSRNELLADEAQELMAAARSVPPTIMEGEIYAFNEEDVQGSMIPFVYVKRPGKEFTIKIPVHFLFPYNQEFYKGDDGKRKLDRELRSRIGSTVEFVVYNPVESEQFAYASRIKAMEIRSAQYFKPVKGRKKARYEVNGKAVARVVSVKNNSIKVDIAGAECIMKSEDLSWKALYELDQEFKVGDAFEVKLTSVEEKKYTTLKQTFTLYAVKANKRELDPNPAELYFDRFNEGETVGGIVKAQTAAGIFVEIGGMMDCLCPQPAVGRKIRGEKCLIQITEKDKKKKFIYGRFL